MAASPYITSQATLINYIKEELGYPVVNLEITDAQINNQINKTMEKFAEVAYGGQQMRFHILPTVIGQAEYKLSYDVLSVIRVFTDSEIISGFGTSSDLFSVNQYLAIDIMKGGFSQGALLDIELFNQWSASVDAKLSIKTDFDFNSATKNFWLFEKPKRAQNLGLVVWEAVDPSSAEDTNIFDQRWVKAYATELCRKQWGLNLMKYDGSSLPAGLNLNSAELRSTAEAELEKLDVVLTEMYQLPPDFMIG